MSAGHSPHPQLSPVVLCLGEVIADLVCESALEPGKRPHEFVPHAGGALANVAVAASRAGAPAAFIGGVGDDETGEWLLAGLRDEGVGVDWVATVEGADTPIALVAFDAAREPRFQVYGEHIGSTMAATAHNLAPAIGASAALVIGSNTMVGETERLITEEAVELAHSHGVPILFDPNYRPNRWGADIASVHCRSLAAESAVIKCNRMEAELITGLADPAEAARRLARMGPRLAVVTDGAGAVVTAGAAEVSYLPEEAEVISPLGAGDSFMGALAAGLAGLDWDFSRVAEILPAATRAAAETCGRWSAQ